MSGPSLGDLVLRRVWNHRTRRSRMSNVPQEYAVLVFDVRQAAVSLPFQVHRLKVRVSNLRTKSQKKLSTAALHTFQRFLPATFTAFRRLPMWGSARRCLLSSSLCCHAVFISASTPSPAHQSYAPRGRLARGTNSAAVEIMTSAMSMAMSIFPVSSGIGGSASNIAFATYIAWWSGS